MLWFGDQPPLSLGDCIEIYCDAISAYSLIADRKIVEKKKVCLA